jgi:hypothetical protein
MLRDKIAQIIYEGYTGLSWPDVDEHFNDAARKHADEIMELPEIKQAERMKKGLEAVATLIDESRGVEGLHLNGDIAPWDELRTGGRFETWLLDFDNALKEADHE